MKKAQNKEKSAWKGKERKEKCTNILQFFSHVNIEEAQFFVRELRT